MDRFLLEFPPPCMATSIQSFQLPHGLLHCRHVHPSDTLASLYAPYCTHDLQLRGHYVTCTLGNWLFMIKMCSHLILSLRLVTVGSLTDSHWPDAAQMQWPETLQ